MTLPALLVLVADNGPGSGGQLGSAVGGIVVVDVDGGVGQDAAEIRDDLLDSLGLVVAGNQNGDFIHNNRTSGRIYIQN